MNYHNLETYTIILVNNKDIKFKTDQLIYELPSSK